MADTVCVTQEQRGHTEVIACYELESGTQLWVHHDEARFEEPTSGIGPRATPTIVEDKVYAFGATGILNCLSISTGQLEWSRDVLHENKIQNRNFGMCGSPLVVQDKVIVAPGGNGTSLVCFDRP